jgi:hypothetical protein
MLRTSGVSSQVRKIYFGLICGRKFFLGFLSGFSDSLKSKLILGDIHSVLVFELTYEELLET